MTIFLCLVLLVVFSTVESSLAVIPLVRALALSQVLIAAILLFSLQSTWKAFRFLAQARDHFLAVVSHELKTPLTAMSLRVQMVPREGPLNEKQKRLIRQIIGDNEKMSRMIGTLLDVVKIQLHRVLLNPKRFDLVERVKTLADFQERVQLQTPESIEGDLDPDRFDQILSNLISNAIKYGGEKPFILRMKEIQNCSRQVQIEVQDFGIGIARPDIPKIFRRFERLQENVASGLGMGLYITREMVRAMGGQIGVKSEVGQGTTFIVTLPLDRALTKGAPSPDQHPWTPYT